MYSPTRDFYFSSTLKVSYLLIFVGLYLSAQTVQASKSESKALLNLVPVSAFNRQVVKSGPWSDAATWNGDSLPQEGDSIHVPKGKSLTIDGVYETSIKLMRVDGTLRFETDRDAQLRVDTLFVTAPGYFEIGSEKQRLQADKTIRILIADNGPINREWDPTNISRGAIFHGKTRIYGAAKSAFHKLETFPSRKDAQFTLAEEPKGWKVGDKIVITATRFRKKRGKRLLNQEFQTYDELRTIHAIEGRTITLGDIDDPKKISPLFYTHVPDYPGMPVFAANYTRNIIFQGEGGRNIPNAERGHTMFFHTPDVIVKGAGFYDLGRTDKSKPIDDFKLNKQGIRIKDKTGHYITGANDNPRARYPVHFHHGSMMVGGNGATKQSISEGNAVMGSPGWGFVVHGSKVLVENNASYDVFGSHFVSEDGNEQGAFINNIAIKSEGTGVIQKRGVPNHDLGHSGHGFWLESRNMVLEGNVTSSVDNAGIAYFHRHDGRTTGTNLDIPSSVLLVSNKAFLKGRKKIAYQNVPIVTSKNNIVLASKSGLSIIKSNAWQGHDMRNKFVGFQAYAVMNGLQPEYTQHYTFKDVILVADKMAGNWQAGIRIGPICRDFAFQNVKIEGWSHPILANDLFKNKPDVADLLFVDVDVNGREFNADKDIHSKSALPKTKSLYNPSLHTTTTAKELVEKRLSFNLDTSKQIVVPKQLTWRTRFDFKGIKTDSVGEKVFVSRWKGNTMLRPLLEKGYYTRENGSRFLVLTDLITDRLTGEEKVINVAADIVHKYKFLGPNLGRYKGVLTQ